MKKIKTENSYTKSTALRISKFVHILLTLLMFSACLYNYNVEYNHRGVGSTRFMLFVILYAAVLCFSLRTYKAYDFGLTGTFMLTYSQTLSNLIAGGAFYIVFVIANSTVFTPLPLIILIVTQGLFNALWSFAANKTYFKVNPPKKTALVYQDEASLYRLRDAYELKRNFEVIKKIKVDGEDRSWLMQIDDCEVIFISDLPARTRNKALEFCVENSITCYTAPHIGDILMMGANHMDMFSVPVFEITRATPPIEYHLIKRAVDIFCSLAGIILLSPVMLLTAAAIKLYDKGPVFYKQVRLTQNGKKFDILKFRSMKVDAESDGVARLAGENDSRITPIGKIIRACRVDELPQLFNILRGDMTIVGPRPERPEIAAQYEEELPSFNLRLQVKAGLTGLAQVYGRYNTEPYDKLQMDLMYINEMSFVTDLRLIFATVKILFIKDSTQGTADGRTTAMAQKDDKKEVKLK